MTKILSFLRYLIPFTLLLFVAQYYSTNVWIENHNFFYATWSIYLFFFISTLLIYVFLVFINLNFTDFTGFAFLGTIFIKMMAAVVFLIPLIQSKRHEKNFDIAAFFVPYFLFLLFETIFAVRLLNKRQVA